MKVAVLGGGPAGLYFAITMKLRDASHEVTVFERNKPDDTFGWGVVLSAETLDNLTGNDPVSAVWIRRYFAYWDDIAVIHKGVRTVSTGHGFCGIGRKRLLLLLQRRARELGIELSFETEVADPQAYMADARSGRRRRRPELARPRRLRRHLQARHRHAQMQVRLARHPPEIRRRLHLHLREDRARLGVGARLPVRRRYRDLHRRMQRGDLEALRLRRDDAAGVDRDLRADLREISRRPQPDDPTPATSAARPGSISRACCASAGRTRTSR